MLQSTSSDWGYSPLAFAKEAPGFSRGEWSLSQVDPARLKKLSARDAIISAGVLYDKARQGAARQGKARQGARHGMARLGSAGRGKEQGLAR
jgi:hypothetical protein